MSMKYLIESLHQAVLSEGKASIALRQVAKDFGASSAASQIMDDNVRDVSTRMVDYLVRHSLKMAMRQPASKVSAFNPSALIGRIGSIDPVTDVDTAFSASKKLSKTVENASEEGGGTPEMAAVAASVKALRSLRAMLRKNPDAATASINDLSSDIATAANAIGAASKSPRHVKLAIVSAITGEPLPSEDGEAGSAPQVEARGVDPVFFLDGQDNVWQTCSCDDKGAKAFGPRGCAKKIRNRTFPARWKLVGNEGGWDTIELFDN
jgi:hypothetical protein